MFCVLCFGFGVWSLGLGVWGLREAGVGGVVERHSVPVEIVCLPQRLGVKVSGFWFKVSGFWFLVSGLRFLVSVSGFRV